MKKIRGSGSIAIWGNSRNSRAANSPRVRAGAAGCLYFARHFTLLAALAAALAATGGWRPHGVATSFGFYGALHAAAVVATLRQPRPSWRTVAFIAIAAMLSALSATMGIGGGRVVTLPGMEGPALFLTLSSGLGAASYALLIRYIWIGDLPLRAVAALALSCAAATLAGLMVEVHFNTLNGLWLAVGWWFAFSAGLKLACREPRSHAGSRSIP